jgi:hypothetical protein
MKNHFPLILHHPEILTCSFLADEGEICQFRRLNIQGKTEDRDLDVQEKEGLNRIL